MKRSNIEGSAAGRGRIDASSSSSSSTSASPRSSSVDLSVREMGDRSQTRGTRVYVGGLTNEVTKEEIETEFERYGKLNSVWVALNPPGFAFVEFAEKEDAEAACDNLNNTELLGSTLRVELSRARRRGGGRGGGFGGRGFGGGRGGGFRRGGGGGGRDGGYPRSRSPFRSNRGFGRGGGGFNRNRGDGDGGFRGNYGGGGNNY